MVMALVACHLLTPWLALWCRQATDKGILSLWCPGARPSSLHQVQEQGGPTSTTTSSGGGPQGVTLLGYEYAKTLGHNRGGQPTEARDMVEAAYCQVWDSRCHKQGVACREGRGARWGEGRRREVHKGKPSRAVSVYQMSSSEDISMRRAILACTLVCNHENKSLSHLSHLSQHGMLVLTLGLGVRASWALFTLSCSGAATHTTCSRSPNSLGLDLAEPSHPANQCALTHIHTLTYNV
jgi:hypothetical protein